MSDIGYQFKTILNDYKKKLTPEELKIVEVEVGAGVESDENATQIFSSSQVQVPSQSQTQTQNGVEVLAEEFVKG